VRFFFASKCFSLLSLVPPNLRLLEERLRLLRLRERFWLERRLLDERRRLDERLLDERFRLERRLLDER
jgi:hypothetical protein